MVQDDCRYDTANPAAVYAQYFYFSLQPYSLTLIGFLFSFFVQKYIFSIIIFRVFIEILCFLFCYHLFSLILPKKLMRRKR